MVGLGLPATNQPTASGLQLQLRNSIFQNNLSLFSRIFTLLATVELCSRVADQVHWETMVVAVNPMETLPPASKAVSRLSASR